MAAVIAMRTPAKAERKRPASTSAQFAARLLAAIRRQSEHVQATHDWTRADDLQMLAYLARTASPRAKSINWYGINFPLRQGFAINTVLCPATGRPLVGTVAL